MATHWDGTAMAKIHINLQQGIIDIEGDEQFVREAFAEVRTSMSSIYVAPALPATNEELAAKVESIDVKPKRKARSKSKPKAESSDVTKSGIAKYYKGKFNPNLDLSDLESFCKIYKPTNNKERALVFSAFLRDELAISPCSVDDIYSCYWAMRSLYSIPEAFGKSLNDARNDGYVTYSSAGDIEIPTAGENALIKLKKKDTEQ